MPKKDLRQMKKNKQKISREDIREAAKKANVSAEDIPGENIRGVEETIAQYENKSEDELMGDLERMISEGKKDGSFSEEMLEAFVKNVAPMMDDAQRKRLDSIAKMIRMNKI